MVGGDAFVSIIALLCPVLMTLQSITTVHHPVHLVASGMVNLRVIEQSNVSIHCRPSIGITVCTFCDSSQFILTERCFSFSFSLCMC